MKVVTLVRPLTPHRTDRAPSFKVTGENLYLLEGGSTFTSNINTLDNPDPSKPVRGTASATAIQTTIVDVNYGSEAFQSSFQQNF